jgi:hypothetical protein
MAALFSRLDGALCDLADNSDIQRPSAAYLDARRIILKKRQVIQTQFTHLLRQGGDNWAADPLNADLDADSLHLTQDVSRLQTTELEEILALNNLVCKAEARYRPDLVEINLYLAELLAHRTMEMRSNPFGPHAICDAFRRAIGGAYPVVTQIKLVIYKTFDKHVMNHLGGFFGQCVDLAVAGGHVRGAGPRHLERRLGARRTGADAADEWRGASIGVGERALPHTVSMTFDTLQALLSRQRPAGSPGPSDRLVLPTEELLALLNKLGQNALIEDADADSGMRQRLSSWLAYSGEGDLPLGRGDEDTLDLVFLFFEHLLQGNDLPDPIKVLLGRLQIPIAKLAILDKGFFSDEEHPARCLLNHIGEAAVGWSEGDDRGPDSLYGMIQRVVERLILDFDGDPGLFARMDRFFVGFLAYEEAQARATEADTLAGLATAMPLVERDAAAEAIAAALARYPQVPAVLETLVREGWQRVLRTTAQQAGLDSPAWRADLELVDWLLWSVQPKTGKEERRQLLRRIPEILRSLRSKLSVSGLDQRLLARWFRDLQTMHLGVLQGEPASAPQATAGRAAAAPLPPVTAEAHRSADPVGAPLRLGTWVELTQDDGTRTRLRLAWHSPGKEKLIFVDRHGRRVPELSSDRLGRLTGQGLATILGDAGEPIADRALRSMLGRLAS